MRGAIESGSNGAGIKGFRRHQLVAVIDDQRADLLNAAADIGAGLFSAGGLPVDRIFAELAHHLTQPLAA